MYALKSSHAQDASSSCVLAKCKTRIHDLGDQSCDKYALEVSHMPRTQVVLVCWQHVRQGFTTRPWRLKL